MPEVEPISSELSLPRYGSYQVLQPLGSGGMSSVYRAVHVETGHEVALKVLPLHLARNEVVLQRFMREARSAESLEHPHIVSIYDRGVDRGRHYLVLEYVEGTDLHGYVQTRGPLGTAEAVRVIRQVAEGLRYAAERGLVHRDIKPSNILRSNSGEIKITDLGLALQWEFEDERVTREGTTVGTVDYMAPEQARDSRAAGPLSDLYSLGCTFYYLLTGIPPFPGGDITDKLSRHAQSPPPDVRDLRPDVPEALSRILIRMMAKRPEDRFRSFDALLKALDQVPVEDEAGGPAVALAPLDAPAGARTGAVPNDVRPSLVPRPPSSIPEISLASLPPEPLLPPTRNLAGGTDRGHQAAALVYLPRTASADRAAGPQSAPTPRPAMSAAGWVALCVFLGSCFVVSVVTIDHFVRSLNSAEPTVKRTVEEPEDSGRDSQARPASPGSESPAIEGLARVDHSSSAEPAAEHRPPVLPAGLPAAPAWVEPDDPEPPAVGQEPVNEETLRRYLPAWALTPAARTAEGPLVVARRVPGPGETGLRAALDETRGTVEIADEGPFSVTDFRVPGEQRVIRARDGFRTIIRLDRPTLEVVRSLPGIVVLDGKSVVLDSLDLIVNVRELPSGQTAMFHCTNSNLTLRNCSVTVVNPGHQPFSLVRTGASEGRGCRLRIENTQVRGALAMVFDLGSGPVDLVLRDSLLVGSQGPLIRSSSSGTTSEHRVSVVGSVTAGRGPAFDLADGETAAAGRARPLWVRSYHSVFGRFQGAGIASVIAAGARDAAPRERVDWMGDRNLYCGWRGFYAAGKEPSLVISSLDALRSTWNGSDPSSQAIPVAWPQPEYLGQAEPETWQPFVPGWESILGRVARPRPFLGAKTYWGFPAAVVPLPLALAASGQPSAGPLTGGTIQLKELYLKGKGLPGMSQGGTAIPPPAPGELLDLLFDADAPDWHGDLGAFLRENFRGRSQRERERERERVRVRVRGAGAQRCSPVRLPDGLAIEIRVEAPPPGAEWLSWSPEPGSRGRALLELHEGSMVLSQVLLRDDPSAAVQSLIHVEEGNLVLHRSRLFGSGGSEESVRSLVSFRAATTRPVTPPPPGLFVSPPDRPVCILGECMLISPAEGLRAEVGRGLLALYQTAVASAGDAIALVPARVARGRFEADLVLDHCTMTSETNIVHLDAWPGREPGPDRPWLIQTDRCAFIGGYERRVSDTVLFRSAPEAMARGLAFWQGIGDAIDVDRFAAVEGDPPSGRSRDVVFQWVNLWGSNHQQGITGPRAGSNLPSVRLFDRLRPGRVEPADLVLDPGHHPGRPTLDVGADLSRQGVVPRPPVAGRRR